MKVQRVLQQLIEFVRATDAGRRFAIVHEPGRSVLQLFEKEGGPSACGDALKAELLATAKSLL